MSESKHTKGPWAAIPAIKNVLINSYPHTIYPVGTKWLDEDGDYIGVAICILPDEDNTKKTRDYCKANAKLIASAPSLLSELEQLRGENENSLAIITHFNSEITRLTEEKDNFAISFAVWAMHNTQAQAYQAAGITAYNLLEKYKSRPYIDTENTDNQ